MSLKQFLKRIRRWKIVAWLPTGVLSEEGVRELQQPILIKGRWEDYFGEDVDAIGKTFVAKGRVFVDRDLPIGTVLKRPPADNVNPMGYLEDPTGTTPFSTETEVYEVRKKETIPLLRVGAANFHWTVVLSGRND